eukprot:gene27076-biopygen17634
MYSHLQGSHVCGDISEVRVLTAVSNVTCTQNINGSDDACATH